MRDLKQRLRPPFLVFAGLACLAAYPLHVVWPSGWDWGMEEPRTVVSVVPTADGAPVARVAASTA